MYDDGAKPKSIGKLASYATRENSLINSTIFSTLIDGDSFPFAYGKFLFYWIRQIVQ